LTVPSRCIVVIALVAIAAATSVAVGSTRSCAGADCVPDLVGVDVRTGDSHLVVARSGGGGGLIADLSPDDKRVLIEQGLRLVTETLTGHVIARVADGLGTVGSARWSPDGTLIAFTARGGGTCGSAVQLWVVQPSGDGLHKLSECANYPAWSPDSKHIVFIGNFSDAGSGSVSTIDADGTGRRDLADWSSTSAAKLAWSPRNDRIAFTTGSGAGEVDVVHVDGAGSVARIRHSGSPAWRPDGKRLAIVRVERPYDRLALQIVSLDGSHVQRVDRGAGISLPAWSRSGRLAYVKTPIQKRAGGIYVTRQGSTPRRLTHEPTNAVYFGIFWSPRGDRILYLRCRT
jgi:Tol biopolymer transport system component